jgi:hypothetical protein
VTEGGRGHVTIAGHRFPVHDIRLVGTEIVLLVFVRGPFGGATGPVTVFSEDGQGTWQGSQAVLPAVDEGSYVFHYGMTIAQILRKP